MPKYTAINVTIKGTLQEAIDSLRAHALLTPEVQNTLVEKRGTNTEQHYTTADLANDEATERHIVDWYNERDHAASLPPQMPFPLGTLIHYAYVDLEDVPEWATYESSFEP